VWSPEIRAQGPSFRELRFLPNLQLCNRAVAAGETHLIGSGMGVSAHREEGHREGGAPFTTATARADARWHRALVGGFLLALIVHLGLLFSVRSTPIPRSPFSAAGPNQGDVRAAAGGSGGLTMVEIRNPTVQEPEEVVEPVPVPAPVPVPEPVIEPVDIPDTELAIDDVPITAPGVGEAGSGGEEGSDEGPGTATGEGEGGGGTEDGGDSGLVAPRPRGILIPPAGRPRAPAEGRSRSGSSSPRAAASCRIRPVSIRQRATDATTTGSARRCRTGCSSPRVALVRRWGRGIHFRSFSDHQAPESSDSTWRTMLCVHSPDRGVTTSISRRFHDLLRVHPLPQPSQ
jgi:hypothetical protein